MPDKSPLPVLVAYDRDEIRSWIRALCARVSVSPTTLARAADVAPSTVNRFLNDISVKHQPSTSTLSKLERAAERLASNEISPAAPSVKGLATLSDRQINHVVVVGFVEAGNWRAAIEWAPGERYTVTIPKSKRAEYQHLKKAAFEVRGPSMDELYPPGTVVICVDLIELGRPPHNKERVMVRRLRDSLVEASVKEYREDDSGRWLWPRSRHPAHQQPIEVTEDGAGMEIAALVIGSYRPE